MSWKKILTHVAADAEAFFDQQKRRLEVRLGRTDPIQIVAYRWYGTRRLLQINGRVLQQRTLPGIETKESMWTNMLHMYRRFESDEVPGTRIQAEFLGQSLNTVTDEEGYFVLGFPVSDDGLLHDALWHEITVKRLDEEGNTSTTATAKVMVPSARAGFGVISDIDDTIIKTNAANFVKMAWLTFINSARTRLPFKGVTAFYQGLHAGGLNPIFYLSSSPWNLYDLLIDFMSIHDIPAGPLLLRDLGIDKEKFITTGHFLHKRTQIETLLSTYPALSFILIGDSGQHDPEIFETVVEDFPGRILAIYIRDVTSEERDQAVSVIAKRVRERGVDMLLVPDTRAAAEHAVSRGFILAETLEQIDTSLDEYAQDPAQLDQSLTKASIRSS